MALLFNMISLLKVPQLKLDIYLEKDIIIKKLLKNFHKIYKEKLNLLGNLRNLKDKNNILSKLSQKPYKKLQEMNKLAKIWIL